ncbi:phosphate acetyltransferase [Mycoplasmoides alvi]|uniref:phosphate acetyltransferase n=1 Tax=Mycoplasmoides alvi TaxID=78580 RepID=UPI00051ABD2C|nr:phosphate acetyltransferase [Mycoplasmoides alvi]
MSSIIKDLSQFLINTNKISRIILVEGWSKDVQQAAEDLVRNYPIIPVLLFKTKTEVPIFIHKNIQKIIIDSIDLSKYANFLYSLRKEKGMTLDQAYIEVQKPNVLASLMVKMNEVDGEVCGKEYSTKDTLKPALQIVKTSILSKLVSSVFLLERMNEKLIFADCAININPTAEELVEITKNTIDFTTKVLKIVNPIVALLSYSTLNSGSGESVDKVKQACEILKNHFKNTPIQICGEIQFDAAYVDDIRRQKAPHLNLEKRPDIYIFPNIDAGNIGYKIAQRLGNFNATGPILVGLDKPINDLSRGASVREIINVAVITAAQSIF